ncbi:uncharacterized protein LOC133831960 [Humulus lupulus]|uniref:uncharacterized protein LOC133831960 n=1 Tax=Humulus lupulus TaxID=3486 RepID=UPI002B4046FA|nr:uncharacterized protein LOC133831960 [Humulus lupulus]
MGPFSSSLYNKYILLVVDYVSKWVEAAATPTNDRKYEFCHCTVLAYHPQGNGQEEVSNRAINSILEKTVKTLRKDWSKRLDDSLWAYRKTFKTPIEMSPYHLVFGKACHFPVELEHHLYWAVKKLNFYLYKAGENRHMELKELDEFRNEAYENAKIYKEKSKAFHDKRILHKDFQPGDKVLLYNSRLKLFPGKLKSRWSGPFTMVTILSYGAVQVHSEKTRNFKVNYQQLKHYIDGQVDQVKSVEVLCTGVWVECNIDNIDALYGLPVMSQKDDEYYQLAYYSDIDWNDVAETLGILGPSFVIQDGHPNNFKRFQMNRVAKAWTLFVSVRLMPNTHLSEVGTDRCLLVLCHHEGTFSGYWKSDTH